MKQKAVAKFVKRKFVRISLGLQIRVSNTTNNVDMIVNQRKRCMICVRLLSRWVIWFRRKGCFMGFLAIKYSYVAFLKFAILPVLYLIWFDYFHDSLDSSAFSSTSKREIFTKMVIDWKQLNISEKNPNSFQSWTYTVTVLEINILRTLQRLEAATKRFPEK